MNVLILGGTSDAIALATAIHTSGHRVISSMAGRTKNPVQPEGKLIVGGFGGVEGLADYLKSESIDYLVDATHPFAHKISNNAVIAANSAKVPLIRLDRKKFTASGQDDWWRINTMRDIALALPAGAVAFLTVGRQKLQPFINRPDVRFVVRSIEPPEDDLPANFTCIQGRPPFSQADEITFMKREGVTHLVSKDSGSALTAHKLEAAFVLKIQVLMLNRPVLTPAPSANSVESVLEILAQAPAPARRFFFLPWLRKIWAKPGS